VCSDFIHAIDELCFQRRALLEQIFTSSENFSRNSPRVLDDPFANFKCEIQTGMSGIALLELFDDAQGMKIVVEACASDASGRLVYPRGMAESGWPMS